MATKTSEAECKDCREAGGFPAEDEAEKSDGCITLRLRSCEHEDEAHAEIRGEDVTGFEGADCHETAGEETVECVEALGCGEDVG